MNTEVKHSTNTTEKSSKQDELKQLMQEFREKIHQKFFSTSVNNQQAD